MSSAIADNKKNQTLALIFLAALLIGGFLMLKKYMLVRFDIDSYLPDTSGTVITVERLTSKQLDTSLFSNNILKEFKDYSVALTDPNRVPIGKKNPFESD